MDVEIGSKWYDKVAKVDCEVVELPHVRQDWVTVRYNNDPGIIVMVTLRQFARDFRKVSK